MSLFTILLIVGVSLAKDVLISNETALQNMHSCLDCHYILVANITLSRTWVPVGDIRTPFTGSFDGDHNSITFLGVGVANNVYAGLFGVTRNATITNLVLLSTEPLMDYSAFRTITLGLIAGYADSTTILGCSGLLTSNIISGNNSLTFGGLAGNASASTFVDCFANLTVKIAGGDIIIAGGLIGNASTTEVRRCNIYAAASIATGTSASFGGMIGVAELILLEASKAVVLILPTVKAKIADIGGLIGRVMGDNATNSVYTSFVSISVNSSNSMITALGGAVGSISGSLIIHYCNIVLSASNFLHQVDVGGIVGHAVGKSLNIVSCYANATVATGMTGSETDLASNVSAGGLIGCSTESSTVVSQSSAIVDFTVVSKILFIGGIVGDGLHVTMSTTGALGAIIGIVADKSPSEIGGVGGLLTTSSVVQCYFVGTILFITPYSSCIGGLVSTLTNSSVELSYAIVNMTSQASDSTAGAIGRLEDSNITGSYLSGSIVANVSTQAAIGGLVGIFEGASNMAASFAVVIITMNGNATCGFVGGFSGLRTFEDAASTVTNCYAMGLISLNTTQATGISLGGFAGSIFGAAVFSSCIAYVNISANGYDNMAGLFAGYASAGTPPETSLGPDSKIEFVVVYVAPEKGLDRVLFVGVNDEMPINNSYCAQFPKTIGCTAPDVLNNKTFLKAFDFSNTFQLDPSLANGSLALKKLPAPVSGSSKLPPKLRLPDASLETSWTSKKWVLNKTLFYGYPFILAIDYHGYCDSYIDCHGNGTSPIDAVCSPKWSSPQRNATAIVDNLHRCNVPRRKQHAL